MEGKEEKTKDSLDHYGIVFISSLIDVKTAESVCRDIIRMNVEQKHNFIQLIINSSGGACADGFSIIDLMEWSRLPIYTTGIGMVASMSLMIFMAGEPGHRILTPRTSILSHRFSGISAGSHSDLVARRKEEDFLHQRILDHYLAHSNIKKPKEVAALLLRDTDTWLTPEEAVGYGLADKVQKRGDMP
ncbi:ATP-dependent Clp protease proteolytic subunit [Candidatus Neomarinimicrobiota bacterium]